MKTILAATACAVFLTLCMVVLFLMFGLYSYGNELSSLRAENARLKESGKTFDAILVELRKMTERTSDSGRGHGSVSGTVRISPVPE